MSWFSDYREAAARTDRLSRHSDHVKLLAAGLFGESGSVVAELKKMQRETIAYPGDRDRLTEEVGDALWYFARLSSILDPDLAQMLNDSGESELSLQSGNKMTQALGLGSAVGRFLTEVQQKSPDRISAARLGAIWHALCGVASAADISLSEAARWNLMKIQSRWPDVQEFAPLFDDDFDDAERLPRELSVEFQEIDRRGKKIVLLRCNGLNLGDRLTDNIKHPDFYRYHDVFHFAHAVYLGWSPVLRSLLKCKRRSDPSLDENEDGARAQTIEEAVSAIVFSRAQDTDFYEGVDHVDYDLLKTIGEFVRGFEVQEAALWQWEAAILNGYRVFRNLRANRCGIVALDLINRNLSYSVSSQG